MGKKRSEDSQLNKRDLCLAVLLLFLGGLLYLFFGRAGAAGTCVTVTVNGTDYGTYSLYEEKTLEIKEGSGVNVLVIKDGSVYMKEADCPDRYCVKQGTIKRSGQSIICLPHKLAARIDGPDKEKEVDVIAK